MAKLGCGLFVAAALAGCSAGAPQSVPISTPPPALAVSLTRLPTAMPTPLRVTASKRGGSFGAVIRSKRHPSAYVDPGGDGGQYGCPGEATQYATAIAGQPFSSPANAILWGTDPNPGGPGILTWAFTQTFPTGWNGQITPAVAPFADTVQITGNVPLGTAPGDYIAKIIWNATDGTFAPCTPLVVTVSAPTPPPTPPPSPSPSPSPPCAISSLTVATTPANRTRTTIGVDELVTISSANNENLSWSLSGYGTLSPSTGRSTRLLADDLAGTETVTAVGKKCSAASIAFNVIAPTGITDVQSPGTGIKHRRGVPNIGMKLDMYLTPATVSFSHLRVRELDALCSLCTGYYAPFLNTDHDPNPVNALVGDVVEGLGSKVRGVDTSYSGATGLPAPFAAGTEVTIIPNIYTGVRGAIANFFTSTSVFVLSNEPGQKSPSLLTATKNGVTVTTTVESSTSTY